jgi:hypothetical protein
VNCMKDKKQENKRKVRIRLVPTVESVATAAWTVPAGPAELAGPVAWSGRGHPGRAVPLATGAIGL